MCEPPARDVKLRTWLSNSGPPTSKWGQWCHAGWVGVVREMWCPGVSRCSVQLASHTTTLLQAAVPEMAVERQLHCLRPWCVLLPVVKSWVAPAPPALGALATQAARMPQGPWPSRRYLLAIDMTQLQKDPNGNVQVARVGGVSGKRMEDSGSVLPALQTDLQGT